MSVPNIDLKLVSYTALTVWWNRPTTECVGVVLSIYIPSLTNAIVCISDRRPFQKIKPAIITKFKAAHRLTCTDLKLTNPVSKLSFLP